MIDQYKLDLVLAEFLRHICQTEVNLCGGRRRNRNSEHSASTSEIRIKYDTSRQIPRHTKLYKSDKNIFESFKSPVKCPAIGVVLVLEFWLKLL
jgi:hypothetical protein